MNDSGSSHQTSLFSILMSRFKERRRTVFLWSLRIAGFLIFIGGLQAYGFYRHFIPGIHNANENLVLLMEEVATNNLANTVLNELGDLRKVSENETLGKEIFQVYKNFIQQFNEQPLTAIEEFSIVIDRFATHSTRGEEVLSALQGDLERLLGIYSDYYSELADEIENPPWYLQPLAAFIKQNSTFEQKIKFNHALYLSMVKDRSSANRIFNELREQIQDQHFSSLLYFAQARLLFDAFQAESELQYYQQAVQNLKESLRNNANYDKPKLFLELLLSMGEGALEEVPIEGEGEGESEGERGVISTNPPTF